VLAPSEYKLIIDINFSHIFSEMELISLDINSTAVNETKEKE